MTWWTVSALVALQLVVCGVFSADDYSGHNVLRLMPERQDHIDFLHAIMAEDTGMNLDFWSEPRNIGHPVDVQIPPQFLGVLKEIFHENEIKYTTVIEDLQKAINESMTKHKATKMSRGEMAITEEYLTFNEIEQWLADTAERCGERCQLQNIGASYEGNPILVIKITDGSNTPGKKVAWIDGGIHAREWIAHAVTLYFIDRMVDGLDTDEEVQAMLSTHDWYFLPCVNPDGYIYSHEVNRMWRKTRVPNDGSACVGADANRNFDHNFGAIGTSTDQCTEMYDGGFPFSQPCTAIMSSYILGLSGKPSLFLTLHSYGQLWMAPWGYTKAAPANKRELMRAGRAAVDALAGEYGTQYQLGSASEILYASSGTSRDWAYGVAGFEYVYTIELRDTGNYGFLLPPDQILPSQIETWAAIRAMFAAIGDRSS